MTLLGKVAKGSGEGKAIGFPTANLEYDCSVPPESGFWSCRALVGVEVARGVAIVGRWTLGNGLPSVEAHLLDWNEDVHGKDFAVSLVSRLEGLGDVVGKKLDASEMERVVGLVEK